MSQGGRILLCVLLGMNVLCLLRFPCWVLRTQNMFPGGPPAPAAHQAASRGSIEDNSPRRLVRCLGLGMSRCEADAVCPQGGTSCPSRGTGDGRVKIAYPSWGSQPLTSAVPGVAPLRSLASPLQPAAFASPTTLPLPGRARLLAGQCWSPAGPPAIHHTTRSGTALAALALPWAHGVVLGLPGKLEEMLEQ